MIIMDDPGEPTRWWPRYDALVRWEMHRNALIVDAERMCCEYREIVAKYGQTTVREWSLADLDWWLKRWHELTTGAKA